MGLLQSGLYEEAHRTALELLEHIPRRMADYRTSHLMATVSLATGREDRLGALVDKQELYWRSGIAAEWSTAVPAHVAVRAGRVPAFLGEGADRSGQDARGTIDPRLVMDLLLAMRRSEDARSCLESSSEELAKLGCSQLGRTVIAAVESGDEQLFSLGLALVARATQLASKPDPQADPARLMATCQARWQLEIGHDPAAAARALEGLAPPPRAYISRDAFLLQVMLSSLGLLKSPSRAEVEEQVPRCLAGTPLDLAQMFLGRKPPVPGELWPHPLWRNEWRLWLALWLEARGERAAAAEVARPAVDPRYGLINNQPALVALLGRLG